MQCLLATPTTIILVVDTKHHKKEIYLISCQVHTGNGYKKRVNNVKHISLYNSTYFFRFCNNEFRKRVQLCDSPIKLLKLNEQNIEKKWKTPINDEEW